MPIFYERLLRTKLFGIGCLGILLLPLIPEAVAEPLDATRMLEFDHELSMDFETPHTRWAKPYANGRTRVLFIAPWYQGSTEGREIVELMQRFDLEADAAYYVGGRPLGDGNPRWYGEMKAGTNRILRIADERPDLYFVNRVDLASLPDVVQAKMEERVREGAGLLVAGDVAPPTFAIEHGTPLEPESEFGAAYRVGEGRVLLYPQREKLSYRLGWETELDYQLERQGRALLETAGRAPQMSLEIAVPDRTLNRSNLSGAEIGLIWRQAPPGTELRVELRRWDGDKQLLGALEASEEESAKLALPVLRSGTYHVDVFARGGRGVEAWATESFTVVSDRKVSAVRLDKKWAELGETLTGRVFLEGQLEENDRVRVRLVDKHGRVLEQEDFDSAKADEVRFAFEVKLWAPMLVRVEAVLIDDGGEEVSSACRFLKVTKRHQNQFNFIVWNFPGGDLSPYGVQSMTQLGATAFLQGGTPPLSLSENEASWVPYASSFRMSSHTLTAMLAPASGELKYGCVHNEKKAMEKVEATVERMGAARAHGTLVYSLGDENAVRGSCLSPTCLVAYRAYLKKEYETIAALNASWGTEYASFDDIALLEGEDLPAENAPKWFKDYFSERTEKDRTDNHHKGTPEEIEQLLALGNKNDEMLALQAENFPRWYDRQAFQSYTYVEWCKRYAKAFRELDPKSLTGFEGTDSFSIRRLTTRSRQGGDLDAFVRELEYFGPYHGPANEVVRSIAPKNFPMGNWIGYTLDPEVLLERYWGQVTNCLNAIQWWRWDNLDGYHGLLSPNLTPFPDGQEMIDDTQVVREGLGDLLMEYDMEDDGIAMLYSMPSTHIAHFDGNRTYGDYKRDHDLWHTALHDAGLQFRYVTDRMLRLGEFDAKRYKALILPLAFAIGPKEAEAIREFVRGGGTLIADVRPGIYDGHCKPLDQGILDDVFGIERDGKRDSVGLDRFYVQGSVGEASATMRWGNWEGKEIWPQMKVDPTVHVTTGKALGESFPIHFWGGLKHPVCVVNEFGEGRAILFNFSIYDAPAQGLIEGALASAGAVPETVVKRVDGSQALGVEVTRWTSGDVELIALLATEEGEGEVTVTLPETRAVYDLKAQEAVGTVGEFAVSVRKNRAEFFALLPRTPRNPEIELSSDSVAPGEVAGLNLTVPGAQGKHSVRIAVIDPTGEPVPWFDPKLVVDSEALKVDLPIAHNDPTGEWTITARDLFTGKETAVRLAVEPE